LCPNGSALGKPDLLDRPGLDDVGWAADPVAEKHMALKPGRGLV